MTTTQTTQTTQTTRRRRVRTRTMQSCAHQYGRPDIVLFCAKKIVFCAKNVGVFAMWKFSVVWILWNLLYGFGEQQDHNELCNMLRSGWCSLVKASKAKLIWFISTLSSTFNQFEGWSHFEALNIEIELITARWQLTVTFLDILNLLVLV